MNPRSVWFTLSLVFTVLPVSMWERAWVTFCLKKDELFFLNRFHEFNCKLVQNRDVQNRRSLELADFERIYFQAGASSHIPLEQIPMQEGNCSQDKLDLDFSNPREELSKKMCEALDSYKKKQEELKPRVVGFYTDFLWLRALEEGLAYAEIVPQTNTYQPLISYIRQGFCWDPGVRIAVFGCPNPSTEAIGEWTYLRFTPPKIYYADPNYGILTGLVLPAFNVGANELVNSVSGKWDMTLNSYRIDTKTTFLAADQFYMTPIAGVLCGTIDQAVHVQYGNYLIVSSTDNSPGKIDAKSRFVGLGPEIGLEFKYQFLGNNSIFAGSRFAYLYSWFHTSTLYSELLAAPSDATITIFNSLQSWTPYGQIQIGYSHQWRKKNAWLDGSIAWEEQFWGSQMRLNWFSNIVSPQTGTTLSVGGLVFRCLWSF